MEPAPPDEPLPVAPLPVAPLPDAGVLAAVGTACAVQANDGAALVLALVLVPVFDWAQNTTKFLVVSMNHAELGVVVPVSVLPPPLEISGMKGIVPDEVVVVLGVVGVCADAMTAGIARDAARRVKDFMSRSD